MDTMDVLISTWTPDTNYVILRLPSIILKDNYYWQTQFYYMYMFVTVYMYVATWHDIHPIHTIKYKTKKKQLTNYLPDKY